MKKVLIIVLCIITSISIIACAKKEEVPKVDLDPSTHSEVNEFKDADMTAKEKNITNKEITLNLSNKSDSNNLLYGEHFMLEKKIEDKWYEVPIILKEDYAFKEIGYELKPGESVELKVDWEWLYGSLEPGDYRILKDVIIYEKIENQTQHTLATEFSIK